MYLYGPEDATAVTDTAGVYTFPDLPAGAYRVVPGARGGTFTPASSDVTLAAADVTGVDFGSAMDTYTVFPQNAALGQIVAGLDGNLWFGAGDSVVRMTPGGVSTPFSVPGAVGVFGMAALEGGVAFTDPAGNRVGVLTYEGVLVGVWDVPTAGADPRGITAAADGALYFTEGETAVFGRPNRIGRVVGWSTANDPQFGITDYELTVGGRLPFCIASASPLDGTRLWFTEMLYGEVGTFKTGLHAAGPGAGQTYELQSVSGNTGCIVAGPNGSMWFTEPIASRIGEITLDGVLTEHPIPMGNIAGEFTPVGITVGPDGAVWFAGYGIGRMTAAGAVTRWSLPATATWIAVTADGSVWFTATGRSVCRLVP